jgi:hypothetical protein
VHLIYIDESADQITSSVILTGLAIPEEEWKNAFRQVKDFRHTLKQTDGIYVYKEFHAWKFVSGRGNIAQGIISKGRRCQIFKDALTLVAGLPKVKLFNAVFPLNQEDRAFERLLNRINRTMEAWNSRALLICDSGKEIAYSKMARKMGVFNPIPSQFGNWGSGSSTRNIVIDRIIEDPVSKHSHQSYFIQLVDFCAYALLRREFPLASKSKYGLDKAFALLTSILVTAASRTDPEGIIRP